MIRTMTRTADPANEPTLADVDVFATEELSLPNPVLDSGSFIVDGMTVSTGMTVLVSFQSSSIANGIYEYTSSGNVLARIDDMASGQTIRTPYYVTVAEGDDNEGYVYELDADFVVGSTGNTWTLSEGPEGSLWPNQWMAGPYRPIQQASEPVMRPMVPADSPVYNPDLGLTALFRQSVYLNLNRTPKISEYKRHDDPWDDRTVLNWLINNHAEVILDQQVQLSLAISATLSNKHIIFHGDGWDGPAKVITTRVNVKPFDIGGSTNLRFSGQAVFEAGIPRDTTNIYAVSATSSFENFSAESIWSRGFTHAFRVSAAHEGFRIGELNVYDYPTELPILVTNATGSQYSHIGRCLNIPQFATIATDAAATITAFSSSDVTEHTGTLTADRTLTLSTDNVVKDKTLRIKRTGSGAFNLSVGGLVNLTTNTEALIGWDGVAGAWKLLSSASVSPAFGTANTWTAAQTFTVTDNSNPAVKITQLGSALAFLVEDQASDTTPFGIDASGNVISGHTAALAAQSVTPRIATTGTSAASTAQGSINWATSSTTAGAFLFAKSRGNTIGTHTIVASGDLLGRLSWAGSNGTTFDEAAIIDAEVAGTPGSSADMPGRINLKTSADGSATPTTRVSVGSTNVTVSASVNYAADAQASDTYVITLSPVPVAYVEGMQVIFKANTANTGAATLNVNSLGAKTIVKAVSTALSNNDILAGMMCLCVYDGTNFILMNPRTL